MPTGHRKQHPAHRTQGTGQRAQDTAHIHTGHSIHITQHTGHSIHRTFTQGTAYTTQHTPHSIAHIHTGHRAQHIPHTTKHTCKTFAALELYKITERLLTSSNIIIIEFYIYFITFDYKDVSFAISTSIERSINFLATYFQNLLKEVYSCSQ